MWLPRQSWSATRLPCLDGFPGLISEAGTRTIWITPREAATYLGVGVETIYDACATGGLKHRRLGRRTIRLKRDGAACTRRGTSGTKGLYEALRAMHERRRPGAMCDCPRWGKYKSIRRSLAQWSGQCVDPFRKAHPITVFKRLKVAVDSRQYSPRGERESLGSRQTLKQFIAEWREHYAKTYSLTVQAPFRDR